MLRIVWSSRARPRRIRRWAGSTRARSCAPRRPTPTTGRRSRRFSGLLTTLTNDTGSLDSLQAKTPKGSPDDTAARNAQWGTLRKSYRAFVRGVQGLCDAAPDVAHAQAIATAAGLDYKLAPVRIMPPLRGKAKGNGVVKLFARRPVARRSGAFYEWQMSSDGKTWVAIATTNNAFTVVQGLTPATTVSFRCRTTFKNVTSAWSQADVIVH